MKLSAYLQKKGLSQTWLGGQLGVTQSAVSQWLESDRVPPPHCPKIERLTGGEVRCEEMNDEVDWSYVRSTTSAERNRRRTDPKPQQ